MSNMVFGVFSDGTETLVCRIVDGEPDTADYFKPNQGRELGDYDYAIVEGPILIECGSLKVIPERILSGQV